MRKVLLFLLLAQSLYAAGPKYTYPTISGLDDEMVNVYHDISNSTAGSILQVVPCVTDTSTSDSTNGSYVDTNLTCSITLNKSSSKVLVLASGSLNNGNAGTTNTSATIRKGTTNMSPNNGGLCEAITAGTQCTMIVWDKTPTSGANTYVVSLFNSGGATSSFRCATGSANAECVMYLFEVGQ